MADKRPRFQVEASQATINRAKAVAYGRGKTLTELVLVSLAKEADDEELKTLIEKDLSERKGTGFRPTES